MDNNGEKLKKMRKKCGLSIQEVEKATNIREHIIEALEKNEEVSLPKPYIVSFVKSLNEFYETKLSSSDKTAEETEVSPIIYDNQENVFKVKEEFAKNRIFINDIDENDVEEEDNIEEKNEEFEIIETKNTEQETATAVKQINKNKKHKETKSNEEKEKTAVAPVVPVDEKSQKKKKKQIRYKSVNSKKSIYLKSIPYFSFSKKNLYHLEFWIKYYIFHFLLRFGRC